MKHEMKWITIWILTVTIFTLLILTYFYLNQELLLYVQDIIGFSLIFIGIPYLIWKYKQIKFVEKRTIIIQFLSD